MGTDDFMNGYTGAGTTLPAPVNIVKTDNLFSSVYCDMSNYPEKTKDFTVPIFYEAYFTGNVDDVSLKNHVKNMNSKLVAYLASTAGLCDGLTCDSNTLHCLSQLTKSQQTNAIMGVKVTTESDIRTGCKYSSSPTFSSFNTTHKQM
jgi:hypothetical protein